MCSYDRLSLQNFPNQWSSAITVGLIFVLFGSAISHWQVSHWHHTIYIGNYYLIYVYQRKSNIILKKPVALSIKYTQQ